MQQRVDKVKAPILCLVGPPGVGKTSLGQSIAKATNRKFVRMALGGVRDEAEIRGHRRTYIGSMPGKIVQNMTKVGVRNPLFLLDEIDKLGMDFRGDPSSALLEVLDPEQNHTFQDHYIEVDFDLSDVMFVATSNTLNIPPALLDRMEVIRLSGYTEEEKIHIARDHLLPKLMKNNGVKDNELTVDESALRDIVRYYTREAGVRALEREVGKICRKVIKQLLTQSDKAKAEGKTAEAKVVNVTGENLSDYLGVRRYTFGMAEKENQIGQVTGLAWTEVGGDLLTIEVADMPGKGVIQRTGSLGDVMKESVEAARTVVRSRARRLGFADSVFEKHDMHVHVPEGATPGRSVRGYRDHHGHGVGPVAHPGARRRRHDRRDHAARRSPAHRRPEGKAAGRASRRHQDGLDSGRKRQGLGGDSGQRQESSGNRAGALDRQGSGAGSGAPAGAAGRGRSRQGTAGGQAGGTGQHGSGAQALIS